jgi:hypothetical protein
VVELVAIVCLAGPEAMATPASVTTIAQLRSLPPPVTPDVVSVAYHTIPGDGGGGSFRFDVLSWAPDNNGTVVAPTAGGRGRWIRIYARDLSVRWFGARGDGRTFATAAAQAAVNAVRPGETLHFPPGVYRIHADRGVQLKSDLRLDLGTAILVGWNVNGARCRLLEAQGRRNVLISGGTLVGNRDGSPGLGVGILASDTENLFIENVRLYNFFLDGILVTGNRGCRHVVIRGSAAFNSRRSGLSVVSGSDVTVTGSTFGGSQGQSPETGANVEPGPGASVIGIRFASCTFTRNAGVGLYVHAGWATRSPTSWSRGTSSRTTTRASWWRTSSARASRTTRSSVTGAPRSPESRSAAAPACSSPTTTSSTTSAASSAPALLPSRSCGTA